MVGCRCGPTGGNRAGPGQGGAMAAALVVVVVAAHVLAMLLQVLPK